jgi:hypothetical protein
VLLRGTFSGSRLKLFFKRQRYFYSPDDEVSEARSDTSGSESDSVADDNEWNNGFTLQPPMLIAEQRAQYAVFASSDEE